MNRLRSESGFTLPELLVSMAIALIVSLAVFSLVEVVMKKSGEIAARVDTTQRARIAMDQVTRQLRSQVCGLRSDRTTDDTIMDQARSVEAATPTSVTVFADFSSETLVGGQIPSPDLRKIAWAANTFTETVTKGQRTTEGRSNYSYTNPVISTRPFLTNVAPMLYADPPANTKPIIFRFFRFQTKVEAGSNAPQPTVEIAANGNRALTQDELESVAKITVNYRVLTTSNKTVGSTAMQNEVYVRTADPNATTPKPTCLTF